MRNRARGRVQKNEPFHPGSCGMAGGVFASKRSTVAGCNDQPTSLVIGQNAPRIARGPTAVYWTSAGDGTVMKVAK
jgi:hypothetical protein